MRATLAATVAYILSLGFTWIGDGSVEADPVFLSPGEDSTGDFNVTVYRCTAGYYCVDIDGGYRAPIVWDGERQVEFVEWLNEHHAGWDAVVPA